MTETTHERVYLKKAELAKTLGVSPRTIDNWIARRTIPVLAVSPRLYRFDLAAVKKALTEQFEIPAEAR